MELFKMLKPNSKQIKTLFIFKILNYNVSKIHSVNSYDTIIKHIKPNKLQSSQQMTWQKKSLF